MVDSNKDGEKRERVTPIAEVLRYVPLASKLYEAQLRADAADMVKDSSERLAAQKLQEFEDAIARLQVFNGLVEKALKGGFRVAVNDTRDIFAEHGRIITTRIRLGDPNERMSRNPEEPTHQLSFFLSSGGGETRREAIEGISSRGVGVNHARTLPAENIMEELKSRPTPDTSISINGIGLYLDDNSRVSVIPGAGISFQHRTGESGATVHGLVHVGNTPHYSSLDRGVGREVFHAKEQAIAHFPKANLFSGGNHPRSQAR